MAALLPRLYVALSWAKEPVWDGHYYHFGATRIAAGLGYSEDVLIGGVPTWKPWCHYPVGYSGLLGFVYRLLGAELWVAPLTNAVFGALTAVLVFLLARRFLAWPRAVLAGALCAGHPGLIAYTALLMTEPLSAFTLLLCGVIAATFAASVWGWLGAGVVLGLGTLVRPTALLAVPWLWFIFAGVGVAGGVHWFSGRRGWMRPLVSTALAALVTLATIAPWTLRNCAVMDGCALVSTNGGWNLAIGAVTDTGRFTALKAEWGCPGPGQVQQDRCWGEVGRRKIAEDPLRWLSMMPRKLAHTYNHESFAVGYLAEADPAAWPDARKDRWRSLLTVFHHLLMFASALSLVALPRRQASPEATRWLMQPAGWIQTGLLVTISGFAVWGLQQVESPLYWLIVVAPLLAFLPLPGAAELRPAGIYAWGLVLMTSVTHAVFFGDDRYHLTVSPVLCMLAAGALRRPANIPSCLPAGAERRRPSHTPATPR